MMLVIGAMVLLGILALSVNRALQDSDIAVSQSGGALQALGVAQAIIEDAGRLAFDERLVHGAPTSLPGGLTPADSVSQGPDGGEADVSLFDDLDDYNRYTQDFNVGGEAFRVRVSVGYIEPHGGGAGGGAAARLDHRLGNAVRLGAHLLQEDGGSRDGPDAPHRDLPESYVCLSSLSREEGESDRSWRRKRTSSSAGSPRRTSRNSWTWGRMSA